MAGWFTESAYAKGGKASFKDALARVVSTIEAILQEPFELVPGVAERTTRRGCVQFAHLPDQLFFAVLVSTSEGAWQAICAPLEETGLLFSQQLSGALPWSGHWWEGLSCEACPAPARTPTFLELALLAAGHSEPAAHARYADRLQDALAEKAALEDLLADAQESVHNLTLRVAQLEKRKDLEASASAWSAEHRLWDSASSLEYLETWATAQVGKVALTGRALSGAKKSLYAEPGHIYKALAFLAGPYRDYRCGKLSKPDMEAALAKSGCQLAGSAGASVAGMQGDAYFVKWGGRRVMMDMHLRRGGGRDERYCLRIYFFWDAESQQVVVGWLPSHLDNSLT